MSFIDIKTALLLGLPASMVVTAVGGTIATTKTSEVQTADASPIADATIFHALLKTTQSEMQRTTLLSVGDFLARYNITFAEKTQDFIFTGTGAKSTKAALSWDEAMALTLVYNNFSEEKLAEILNGDEIDANELCNAYRDAMLQLMGAHVIETRETPVRMEILLQSEAAKAFYEKYHELFLRAKEGIGAERVYYVQSFYNELSKDFSFINSTTQEGISHSDTRPDIKPEQLSIVPMVAAAEMLFQNLKDDLTLSQAAVDALNNANACKIADSILTEAWMTSLKIEGNDKSVSYEDVRDAAITFLIEKKAYGLGDEERDLSDLPSFQATVNGLMNYPYFYGFEEGTTVVYYEEGRGWVVGHRGDAVSVAGEEAVRAAEARANEAIAYVNEQARKAAEAEADRIAAEMQEKADQRRKDLEAQVQQSGNQYNQRVEDANKTITGGGNVSGNDLGSGTSFGGEYTDESGNLNDSVSNITTDGTGAVDSGTKLPDPNENESGKSSDIIEYEESYNPNADEGVFVVESSLRTTPTEEIETGRQYTYKITHSL